MQDNRFYLAFKSAAATAPSPELLRSEVVELDLTRDGCVCVPNLLNAGRPASGIDPEDCRQHLPLVHEGVAVLNEEDRGLPLRVVRGELGGLSLKGLTDPVGEGVVLRLEAAEEDRATAGTALTRLHYVEGEGDSREVFEDVRSIGQCRNIVENPGLEGGADGIPILARGDGIILEGDFEAEGERARQLLLMSTIIGKRIFLNNGRG